MVGVLTPLSSEIRSFFGMESMTEATLHSEARYLGFGPATPSPAVSEAGTEAAVVGEARSLLRRWVVQSKRLRLLKTTNVAQKVYSRGRTSFNTATWWSPSRTVPRSAESTVSAIWPPLRELHLCTKLQDNLLDRPSFMLRPRTIVPQVYQMSPGLALLNH